jgi:hypothetical protein
MKPPESIKETPLGIKKKLAYRELMRRRRAP